MPAAPALAKVAQPERLAARGREFGQHPGLEDGADVLLRLRRHELGFV